MKLFLPKMGEQSSLTLPIDRTVEQATVSMKKGAYLLKCRRKGKPKFCPFRLSMDEKYLIWYSGHEEKQLKLSTVANIIPGQKTLCFQKQLHPAKESQSFSLIYANGERSLDLICKDKAQADSWFLGLKSVISRNRHPRTSDSPRSLRGIQSCLTSPAGFIRRKHNLGLLEDATESSQVRSLCSSPSRTQSDRRLSDGLSHSDSIVSDVQSTVLDISKPYSPYVEPNVFKKRVPIHVDHRSVNGSTRIEKKDILKDVLIWGEGIEGGFIGGGIHDSGTHALLPKLLECTTMLDIESMSLGAKHAALVTKQGDVFCWGEEKGGRLGHNINIDSNRPKLVDSLSGVTVKSVVCSEYQTCALTDSGEVYTWGDNCFTNQWLPRKLSGTLNGITVSSVGCGEWHMAVVSTSGQLFTYGDGTFGALGHGNLQTFHQPKEVESLKGLWVKSVACGSWHTAAIIDVMVDRFKFNDVGGKLFTWGDGDGGRLGHGNDERKLLPTCVSILVDHDFVQVSCGRMLTVGLTNTGVVYTMGSSVHGQLGNPKSNDASISVAVGKLKEEFVKAISCGSYHVAALTSGGNIYTWGKNSNGQLGLGDTEERCLPTFVEALEGKVVESITCGSTFTAAICLHQSISSKDQSTCNGCKLQFGFTRKKHNCYNCGLLFCRTCCNKKSMNAALAPKTKAFRVCDLCFNNMHRLINSGRLPNREAQNLKILVAQQKACLIEKEDRGVLGFKHGNEEMLLERSLKARRWGQVPCPDVFKAQCRKSSASHFPSTQCQPSEVATAQPISNAMNPDKGGTLKSDEISIEEVRKLREEAKSLEMQCQIRGEKIKECNRKIEETWSLAREEAAQCKAAKAVSKALALRLHLMSEKVSNGREAKDEDDTDLQKLAAVHSDTPRYNHVTLADTTTCLPPKVELPKDRQESDHSLSSSPLLSSGTLRSLAKRNPLLRDGRLADEMKIIRTSIIQNGTKDLKEEWVDQFEAGVYITVAALSDGKREIKGVRFSRKRFTQKTAEQWWEENQVTVYRTYNIEGYINSNQNLLNS